MLNFLIFYPLKILLWYYKVMVNIEKLSKKDEGLQMLILFNHIFIHYWVIFVFVKPKLKLIYRTTGRHQARHELCPEIGYNHNLYGSPYIIKPTEVQLHRQGFKRYTPCNEWESFCIQSRISSVQFNTYFHISILSHHSSDKIRSPLSKHSLIWYLIFTYY